MLYNILILLLNFYFYTKYSNLDYENSMIINPPFFLDDSLPADKESSLLYNYTLKEKEYPYKCTYDGCDKKYIRKAIL